MSAAPPETNYSSFSGIMGGVNPPSLQSPFIPNINKFPHYYPQQRNSSAFSYYKKTSESETMFRSSSPHLQVKQNTNFYEKELIPPPVEMVQEDEEMISSPSEISPEGQYPCPSCDKTFTIPARLQRHLRTHTGEKPFRCEFCDKTFSVKENLNVHRRIHTKERPFSCAICGRAFEHSGKLHRHMRTHTGERPHKCEVCGKTFVQSGQLVIHMRAHTGEKPYSCTYCIKAFTCSKQLKVHIRTHTGEKPYACDICGKTFGYNHVLKMHKMSHLGERLYKCTLCDKFFSSRKLLDSHIKEHSDDVDNANGICDSMEVNNNLSGDPDIFHKTRRKSKSCKSKKSISASSNSPSISPPKEDDYISDDSGCGTSSQSISPPVSPEELSPNSSPGLLLTAPTSLSPPLDSPHTNLPPDLPNSNLFSTSDHHPSSKQRLSQSILSVRRDLLHSSPPSYQWTPCLSSDILHQHSSSISSPTALDYRDSSSRILSEKIEDKLLSDSDIAVFTTQSGERLACPVNVLMKLNSKDDVVYSQIKKELSLRLVREEAKREKEQKFFKTVILVLESLIGMDRMKKFGHPTIHIDQVIRNALELMKTQPCTEPSLTVMDRVKVNLRLILECCVPDQTMWNQFGWKGKPIEDIVAEFLQQCSDKKP